MASVLAVVMREAPVRRSSRVVNQLVAVLELDGKPLTHVESSAEHIVAWLEQNAGRELSEN